MATTAAIGAGVAGVAGSMYAAKKGSDAAKSAANAQTSAADQQAQVAEKQLQMQWDMYQQSRADLYPTRWIGAAAANKMAGLMGMGYIPPDTGVTTYGGPPQDSALSGGSYQPGAMVSGGSYLTNAPGTGSSMTPDQYFSVLMKEAEQTGDVSKAKQFLADYKASGMADFDESTYSPFPMTTDPRNQWMQSYLGQQQQQQNSLAQGQQVQQAPVSALSGMSPEQARAQEMKSFYTSPGYEFRLSEGLRMEERSAAARGGLLSGATLKALQKRGEGLAASEYGDYWNRLAAMANLGQTSSSQTGQLGASAASGMGSAYNALSGAYGNAGNARASSYINQANAWTGGISSGINNAISAYYAGNRGGGGSALGGYTPPVSTDWSISTPGITEGTWYR